MRGEPSADIGRQAGMTRLRALVVLLTAAALAVAAAWVPTSAGGGPLTLEIDVSPRTCTAGSLATATWLISGGEGPYRLTIDGESVDAGAESAMVRCGSPLADAPAWLSEMARRAIVRAEVVDVAGAVASVQATLQPAPPLPPPASITAGVVQRWGDHRQAVGYVRLRTVESSGGEADAPPPGSQLYVIRWRETGERRWNYEAPAEGGEDSLRARYSGAPPPRTAYARYRWELGGLRAGVSYEFQASRLRGLAERETPEALRWGPPQTTVSAGPPRDVTAHATRDSVTVSWESNHAATEWVVSISESPANDRSSVCTQPQTVESVSGTDAHVVHFRDLRPGRTYTVEVRQSSYFVQSEVAYDIRTAGEREEQPEAQLPTIIKTEFVEDEIHVEWYPAAECDREYRIHLSEYGIRGAVTQNSRTGQTTAVFTDIKPETTYRVVLERPNDNARDEDIIHTRRLGIVSTPRNYDPTPALYVNWRDAFHVSWDSTSYGDDYAEVEWRRGRHAGSSFGAEPIVLDVDQPGRYEFRARFRRHDGWSDWIGPIRATTRPAPPDHLQFDEQLRSLRIEWSPSKSLTPVDGYRVYVSRWRGLEAVYDVRGATEITIPIQHDFQPYVVEVAAVNDSLGEGQPSRPYRLEERGKMYLTIGRGGGATVCDARGLMPALLEWRVVNGAGPFTLHFPGQEPFETSMRSGLIEIYCDSPGETVANATVVDALGITSATELRLVGQLLPNHDRRLLVEIDGVWATSVYHEQVYLKWHCGNWWEYWQPHRRMPFALRWRSDASNDWTYVAATASGPGYKIYNGCTWLWTGLAPGARYEFQLATLLRPEEIESPESLQWSSLESVTMLREAADVRLTRIGERTIVTWRAQPSAWAYQVVLHGDGERWWKYYLPSGNDTERAVFRDLPSDGRYEVEIITPPRVAGEPEMEPGFVVPFPPH